MTSLFSPLEMFLRQGDYTHARTHMELFTDCGVAAVRQLKSNASPLMSDASWLISLLRSVTESVGHKRYVQKMRRKLIIIIILKID